MSKVIGTFVPLASLISETTNSFGVIENSLPFIDWLVKTKQSAWQMLPLHETQLIPGSKTEHVPSPYKGYGIGLDPRYLSEEAKKRHPSEDELASFIQKESSWIHDYALFCALRDEYGTDDWRTWNEGLRKCEVSALVHAKKEYGQEIHAYLIEQFQLHREYFKLKEYASTNSVQLIGDLPFYLSVQSPLVWAHQDCFLLSEDLSLQYVSGIPHEASTIFGRQVWGHPIYNWDDLAVREQIVGLWKERIVYSAQLFHMLRFDHANGFFLYGSIDLTQENRDELKKGPGESVLSELVWYARSVGISVYAEDTAKDLSELRDAMQRLVLSGVRILRFAYNETNNTFHTDYIMPEVYPENCVAYTTTHDTEPLLKFLQELRLEQKCELAKKFGVTYTDDRAFALLLRKMVIQSPAETVIIPIQDWLLSTDRINIPGTEDPIHDTNWHYLLTTPVEKLSIILH